MSDGKFNPDPKGSYSYKGQFPSISNIGKWACPSRIGVLPPGQKCIVVAARKHPSVCVSPGLHIVEWTKLNMERSQIVSAYNARQSGSQVELSRISVSLEVECFFENGCVKGNKILTLNFIEASLDFWALSYFAFFFFFFFFFFDKTVNVERWEKAVSVRRVFLDFVSKRFCKWWVGRHFELESTR